MHIKMIYIKINNAQLTTGDWNVLLFYNNLLKEKIPLIEKYSKQFIW